ncbi:ABC transporter ATP-binding protein [soil metagenome]
MTSAVEAHGLVKTYNRGTESITAVDHVDFTVQPGEVVALAGASGSGKSTLLNLIAGFDKPDRGVITIGGFEVTAASEQAMDAARTRTIGFVFQQFHLVAGLTALENVELALLPAGVPAAERRRRAQEALARLGLEKMGGRRPSQLSGGQQQRVAIARAMVAEPKVILADEPTAALDRETASSLLDQLVALAKEDGAAVLLSTHDPRCMARADRVLTLENGRMTA